MKTPNLLGWIFGIVILFAILGGFAKIMTTLNHNEHMYIAAGVLVSQNKVLYKDFAFLQTPYLPLFYGGLYRIFGIDSYYLLTGKLISFVTLLFSGLTIFLITRHVLGDRILALGFVALFLLNMSIVIPAGEVSNYILPVALSLLAVYTFDVSLSSPKHGIQFITLTGLLLALAAGVKLTYVSVIFPFFCATSFYPLVKLKFLVSRLFVRSVPFVIGLALGSLPMVGFLISDLESFLFNNLGYHFFNTQWRLKSGYTDAMTLASKLEMGGEIFLRADNLVLLSGIFFGGIISLRNLRTTKQIPIGMILAFLLFITGLLTAFAPTPSFFQYYALPVSCLFILLIYSWASRVNGTYYWHKIILLIMVGLTLLSNGSSLIDSIKDLRYKEKWSGLYVQEVSVKIRELIRQNQLETNGKLATLSPLFALEGGLSIYNEMATGPFLYRVGDLLNPEQRTWFIGTSPQTVHHLFANDPPVAILTGFEGDLDQPLNEYARRNNYQFMDIPDFEGNLFILRR